MDRIVTPFLYDSSGDLVDLTSYIDGRTDYTFIV